ncbi:hypothetical protein [Paraburkholderia bannensis]|uniref:hypothetical protein n=1 Tax=Paraburkholderia bannensis TaxID=765414 RepID=UPI002AB74D28|nr:hypothetical protein [Paraburkholderia bannensis]
MKKFVLLAVLSQLSEFAHACGTDAQREAMAKALYTNAEMQAFVCGKNSCPLQDFESGLRFEEYSKLFHGKKIPVCLVEPNLSATNSYTGVFASTGSDFSLQFVSYGTGVKVGVNKSGTPMISEYSVSDPDNEDYSVSEYLWSGKGFLFTKTKKISGLI